MRFSAIVEGRPGHRVGPSLAAIADSVGVPVASEPVAGATAATEPLGHRVPDLVEIGESTDFLDLVLLASLSDLRGDAAPAPSDPDRGVVDREVEAELGILLAEHHPADLVDVVGQASAVGALAAVAAVAVDRLGRGANDPGLELAAQVDLASADDVARVADLLANTIARRLSLGPWPDLGRELRDRPADPEAEGLGADNGKHREEELALARAVDVMGRRDVAERSEFCRVLFGLGWVVEGAGESVNLVGLEAVVRGSEWLGVLIPEIERRIYRDHGGLLL